MVGLSVLTTTSEIRVVRAYLVALWLADVGHIGLTWYGLGSRNLINVTERTPVTSGNIGARVRELFLTL